MRRLSTIRYGTVKFHSMATQYTYTMNESMRLRSY